MSELSSTGEPIQVRLVRCFGTEGRSAHIHSSGLIVEPRFDFQTYHTTGSQQNGAPIFLALNADGEMLAAVADGELRLVDLAAARGVQRICLPPVHPARNITFSQDGTLVAATFDRQIEIWHVGNGERVQSFEQAVPTWVNWCYPGKSTINALAFYPDNNLLCVAETGGFALWQVDSGEQVDYRSRWGPKAPEDVLGIAFSPDGSLLCCATYGVRTVEGGFSIWGISDDGLEEFSRDSGMNDLGAITFTLDGRSIIVVTSRENSGTWSTLAYRLKEPVSEGPIWSAGAGVPTQYAGKDGQIPPMTLVQPAPDMDPHVGLHPPAHLALRADGVILAVSNDPVDVVLIDSMKGTVLHVIHLIQEQPVAALGFTGEGNLRVLTRNGVGYEFEIRPPVDHDLRPQVNHVRHLKIERRAKPGTLQPDRLSLLALSARVEKILLRSGIQSISELQAFLHEHGEDGLLSMRLMAPKHVDEIRAALETHDQKQS